MPVPYLPVCKSGGLQKNKPSELPGELSGLIVGKWELRTGSGGWTGRSDYQPGNGNIYEFVEGRYKQFEAGILVKEGRYEIKKDSSMLRRRQVDMLIFEDETDRPLRMLTIEGNRMDFDFDAYDAGGMSYERL